MTVLSGILIAGLVDNLHVHIAYDCYMTLDISSMYISILIQGVVIVAGVLISSDAYRASFLVYRIFLDSTWLPSLRQCPPL